MPTADESNPDGIPSTTAVNSIGKTTIAALLIAFNIWLVAYFVTQIIKEWIRSAMGLDELTSAQILRYLEDTAWPKIAYLPAGPAGGVTRWLFVRAVWFVERRATRRGVALKRTHRRLDEKLQEIIRAANAQERVRRAAKVVDWAMQGLIVSPAVAQKVCDYEARGRTVRDPLWEPLLAESALHAKRVRAELGDALAELWKPPGEEGEEEKGRGDDGDEAGSGGEKWEEQSAASGLRRASGRARSALRACGAWARAAAAAWAKRRRAEARKRSMRAAAGAASSGGKQAAASSFRATPCNDITPAVAAAPLASSSRRSGNGDRHGGAATPRAAAAAARAAGGGGSSRPPSSRGGVSAFPAGGRVLGRSLSFAWGHLSSRKRRADAGAEEECEHAGGPEPLPASYRRKAVSERRAVNSHRTAGVSAGKKQPFPQQAVDAQRSAKQSLQRWRDAQRSGREGDNAGADSSTHGLFSQLTAFGGAVAAALSGQTQPSRVDAGGGIIERMLGDAPRGPVGGAAARGAAAAAAAAEKGGKTPREGAAAAVVSRPRSRRAAVGGGDGASAAAPAMPPSPRLVLLAEEIAAARRADAKTAAERAARAAAGDDSAVPGETRAEGIARKAAASAGDADRGGAVDEGGGAAGRGVADVLKYAPRGRLPQAAAAQCSPGTTTLAALVTGGRRRVSGAGAGDATPHGAASGTSASAAAGEQC